MTFLLTGAQALSSSFAIFQVVSSLSDIAPSTAHYDSKAQNFLSLNLTQTFHLHYSWLVELLLPLGDLKNDR